MKKTISFLLAIFLCGLLVVPVLGVPEEPVITMQPQNINYSKYSTATYTVKVSGTNLHATWWMEWNGTTYNISEIGGEIQPWEGYAGETYGAVVPEPGVFTYTFGGIGEELNGARIWCVVEDGHYDVASQKAIISVGDVAEPPAILQIPAKVVAAPGESVDLRCIARSPGENVQLSYVWYESDTGNLEDIRALNRGEEVSDFIIPDTSTTGVRFYVCMVRTSEGGSAYSSVVPVYVMEAQEEPTEPEETQPIEETVVPSVPEETEPKEALTTGELITPTEAEPDSTTQPVKTNQDKGDKNENTRNDMQWLLPVGIGIAAAGAGVVVGVILTKKKK